MILGGIGALSGGLILKEDRQFLFDVIKSLPEYNDSLAKAMNDLDRARTPEAQGKALADFIAVASVVAAPELAARLRVKKQPKKATKTSPRNDGAKRSAKHKHNWQEANITDAVKKFVGDDPVVDYNIKKGKKIYRNNKTGIQIVEDISGNYFRIQDTTLSGKHQYLDSNGSNPRNKTLPSGKQAGRSPAEYQEVTHFFIKE